MKEDAQEDWTLLLDELLEVVEAALLELLLCSLEDVVWKTTLELLLCSLLDELMKLELLLLISLLDVVGTASLPHISISWMSI